MSSKTKKARDPVEEILSGTISPSKKLKPDNFWKVANEYPQPEAAAVYVYRLWPVIDRRAAGHRYNYIAVWPVGEAITEERLVNEHGSGTYQLKLTDSNRPKQLREVASATVTIKDPERPPVVDPAEVVPDARENQSYIQGLRAAGAWPDNGGEMSDVAVKELAELNRDLVEEIKKGKEKDPIELAVKAAEAFRPKQDPLELGLRVAELVKDRSNDSKLLEVILQNQAKLTEIVLSRGQGDDLERLERILSIAQRIQTSQPPGTSGWSAFLEGLPETVNGMAQLLGHVVQLRGRAPTAAPPIAPVPVGGAEVNKLTAIGTRAVEAFCRGVGGAEFGASLRLLEPELYEQLRSLGSEAIVGVLRGLPQLWRELAPREAEVTRWVAAALGES